MEPTTIENILKHYGVIRRSGRYPWGSGGNALQSAKDFKAHLDELRSQGLTDPQIAESMGIKTAELRDGITKSRESIYAANQAMAVRLRDKGVSTRSISERMLGSASKESTVRGWLDNYETIKKDSLETIANILRGHLGTKRWLDVGKGNELYMGISDVRLRGAISVLKDEGYKTHLVKLPQLGTNELTNHKILGHPDSTWTEAKRALLAGEVRLISEKSDDNGLSFMTPKPEPVSVSSKRIEVRYKEDGGAEMDGVIELRRGVPDLSLGANRYAQVRVAVDGTHYLKGMAMYADDLPAGTDIRFNTPKSSSVPLIGPKDNSVLKPMDLEEANAGNRFGGAQVHPVVYKDSNGEERTSALNMVNEEGDWDKWSRSLSAQMLSKQSLNLASTQLAKARKIQQDDLNKIMALTNPIVKKQLLLDFADSADSKAVHLKAASLPNQSSHVILPMTSMRPTEVYAPNFDSGTKVALVRYPHGGPFEIPQLTVNNSNTTAKRLMGPAKDAIGIHPSVAQQLSGADFDGDTVIVIPNDSNRIKSKPPLEELKNFSPQEAYSEVPGMTKMTPANTQKEMGKISNLITDMTIKGANTEELARAVKHSMVVIDAEKKNLDYKQSELDNGIKQLKREYQDPPGYGASTIISRSSSVQRVPQQRLARQSEGGAIDPETGKLRYIPTGKTYPQTIRDPATGEKVPTGKIITAQTKGTKGGFAEDARTLSSGLPMEETYAIHANAMKTMANEARKVAVSIKDPVVSPAAKAYYSDEVASLKDKLKNALMNAPLERRAQAIGNATATARIDATPEADADRRKKIQYQSLTDARLQTGAHKERIGGDEVEFTVEEWHAVQAGAVAPTVLREILNNSDMDTVRKLATPTYRSSLTTGQIALAKTMRSSGRSMSEISAALGIPRSTIADNLANA